MKKYSRYKFKSEASMVKGIKPNFFNFLRKNVNKDEIILDLGCGSGELSISLAGYCQKIVGLDNFSAYIKTAKIDKKNKKIKNVTFKLGDGEHLPFKNNIFDLVISSRGPLSANTHFLREALRVLKPGGRLIEETIGETDKIELKKIFKRGQNFPIKVKKLESVETMLKKFDAQIIYSEEFIYYQKFSSISAVARTLSRTPIIEDFNRRQDQEKLNKLQAIYKNNIVLSSHRLWWLAVKGNK